jgi:hypothetical protein
MRKQSMVMGPERHRPKIDCNANYRPVLSSERALQLKIKRFSDQEKKMKNLGMDPTPRHTGRLTVGCKINRTE